MSHNPKRVMVLGAGSTVAPLIECASRLGHETIVVSPLGDYPGFKRATAAILCDIRDEATILKYAKLMRIDAIVSTGTDTVVPIIGRVIDELGLPGTGRQSALACSDKWLMKQALSSAGVATAKGVLCPDKPSLHSAARELGYPLMCKAVDSSGSQGVFQVEAPSELVDAWERSMEASPSGQVLLEEVLRGTEFGAQAIVQGDTVLDVLFHDDLLTPPPVPAPIGHSMPCAIPDAMVLRARIEVQRAIKALGIRDTIANVDLMLAEDTPYIIEIGARMGATCLPETISLFGGFDAYEAVIVIALGMPLKLPASPPKTASASRLLTSKTGGVVTRVTTPASVANHPQLFRLALYCKPGDHVRPFRVGPDRVGDIIVTGPTAQNAQQLAEILAGQIDIEITDF